MKALGFEIRLAARHLSAGRGQTVLTLSTVAAGVLVIVFFSSLIFGLRQMFFSVLTDLLPQVTVSPVELQPAPIHSYPGVARVSSEIVAQNPQRKMIDNWPAVKESIEHLPHVVCVVPAIVDQAFASRGGKQLGLSIYGADPDQLGKVIAVRKYIQQGHYMGLASDEIVIGYKVSTDLGVQVGDRIAVTSNEGVTSSFQIAGIYDNGSDQQLYTGYVTLRAAQGLYRTGTSVKTMLVKTDDLFHADMVADEILAIYPYKVDSWSRQNAQIQTSLAMQSMVAFMISGFSLITAAFAIASVLVVSVLQKGKEIGILKSMGATQRQVFRVFLCEGLGIAVLGSLLGAVAGVGLVEILSLFKRHQRIAFGVTDQLFPTSLTWGWILAAVIAAIISTVIAAVMPARRAAALDPVAVMR